MSTLKSAEEWMEPNLYWSSPGKVALFTPNQVRAIQIDALRHAASIAASFNSGWATDEILLDALRLEQLNPEDK